MNSTNENGTPDPWPVRGAARIRNNTALLETALSLADSTSVLGSIASASLAPGGPDVGPHSCLTESLSRLLH